MRIFVRLCWVACLLGATSSFADSTAEQPNIIVIVADDQDIVTTAITFEEQVRGWLAQINRFREPQKQVPAYAELTGLIDFYGYWNGWCDCVQA